MSDFDDARERLTAFGTELVEIHRWLRRELAELRRGVERYLDGRARRPNGFKAHCMAFCAAVGRHHTGEDAGAFPVLSSRHPELRAVISKMEEDHQLVAGLLRQVNQVLLGITGDPDAAEAARVRAELDGLAAILESHFSFEERRLVTALNSLSAVDGTTTGLLGLDPRVED